MACFSFFFVSDFCVVPFTFFVEERFEVVADCWLVDGSGAGTADASGDDGAGAACAGAGIVPVSGFTGFPAGGFVADGSAGVFGPGAAPRGCWAGGGAAVSEGLGFGFGSCARSP